MKSMGDDMIEYIFKMCMLGPSGVGKTSIRRSFMGLSFLHDHRATIGGDFSVKEMTFGDDIKVTFSIWEVDPSANFRRFRRHYLRNSYAGIVVFDVTNFEESTDIILATVREIDQHTQSSYGKIPLCLIGNKIDLVDDVQPIKNYLQQELLTHPIMQDREVKNVFTSCLTGENVNEMFYLMKIAIFEFLGIEVP